MRYSVLLVALLPSCLVPDWCEKKPCPPPSAEGTCEGQCAPYIGVGWWPAIVAEGAAHCPPEAPFAALASDSPPLLACGVQEATGACSSPGFVCLPSTLPPWTVCVVRDGQHACPGPYPDRRAAESEVTICCLALAGEPS
jgi:hypothetical protein